MTMKRKIDAKIGGLKGSGIIFDGRNPRIS
jgi:hypothetical protein